MATESTVTYWSVSMFTRKTFWVNLAIGVLAVLELQEVTSLIPKQYMGHVVALTAGLNVILRRFTVRPATFMKPGDSKPVEVKKVAIPEPPIPPTSINGYTEIHE